MTGTRPNILLMIADDMRGDKMGVAGDPVVQTPNLDALARSSAYFENGFTTTAICPTSRASILTGQYARRHGIWNFETPLTDDQFKHCFYGRLRHHGYQTGFVGKWGLGSPLPASEFDYWVGFEKQGHYFGPEGTDPEHLTDKQGDQAIGMISAFDEARPFCMGVSFKAPHGPFTPAPRFAGLYEDTAIPRAQTDDGRHVASLPQILRDSRNHEDWHHRYAEDETYQSRLRNYYRLITGLDEVVGKILAHLKASGLYDNTLVIFTSDHGLFLGEHRFAGKWYGFEEAIRIPLILKAPGSNKPRNIKHMALNIDVCVTILDAAGIPLPNKMDGISLLPLMTGHEERKTRCWWLYEHAVDVSKVPKSVGIRTERYKYLRFFGDQSDTELFFDLRADPLERTNLISDAHQSDRIAELKAHLAEAEQSIPARLAATEPRARTRV